MMYFHIYFSSSRYSTERVELETKIRRIDSSLAKGLSKKVKIPEKGIASRLFDVTVYKGGIFQGYSQKDDVVARETSIGWLLLHHYKQEDVKYTGTHSL